MLRVIIAALILWSGMALSQEPPKAPEVKTEQHSDSTTHSQDKTKSKTHASEHIAPIKNLTPSVNSQRKADYEAEKRAEEASEYGVFFGRRLKITDALLTLFTLLLVIVGIGQGIFLYRTDRGTHKAANAAKDSADVASKTLIATQRPWINSEIRIASDFIFGESEARVTFAYILKNIGNAVATNIQVTPKLIPFQFGKISGEPPNIKIEVPQTRPTAELKALCEDGTRLLDNPHAADFMGGHVIFPNDSIPDAVNIHIPNADINMARAQSAYKSLIPVLLFCVTYRSPFNDKAHYTGHAFQLFRKDFKSPGGAREINPDEGNVPANQLVLMRLPFDSSIAN